MRCDHTRPRTCRGSTLLSGTPRVPTRRNKSCKQSDEWLPREKGSFVTTIRSSSTTEVRKYHFTVNDLFFCLSIPLISWDLDRLQPCSVRSTSWALSGVFVCCIFLFPPPLCMVLGLYLYLNLVVYWNKAFLPKCLQTNPIVL